MLHKNSGKMLFISGQISIDENGQLIKGKVGKDLDTEQVIMLQKMCFKYYCSSKKACDRMIYLKLNLV